MRILITGSRTWDDALVIAAAITRVVLAQNVGFAGEVTLVHGHCPTGADAIADRFGRMLPEAFTVERHPADWAAYGRAAGFRRNAAMVELGADVCLAFIRAGSRGATMTADLAERAGMPVTRYVAA